MPEPLSSQSSTPCGRCKVLRDQLYTVGDERDRAIETRENANAVSVRVEAENRRLREALEQALEWLPEPERTTIAGVLA